jgi:hypothetical protein
MVTAKSVQRRSRSKPSASAARQEDARKRKNANEELWTEAAALYRAGLPTTRIAVLIGRDEGTISRNLRARGVEMRRPNDYWPGFDPDLVRRWHADGVRATEMMRRLGIGRRRLYQAFDDLGLPRFGAGRPDLTTGGAA